LGDFSPVGLLFSLGCFKKYILFGLIFQRKKFCINCDKKVLGCILGDFFSNSFGHPESSLHRIHKCISHSNNGNNNRNGMPLMQKLGKYKSKHKQKWFYMYLQN
jgi:hypothetical protein